MLLINQSDKGHIKATIKTEGIYMNGMCSFAIIVNH